MAIIHPYSDTTKFASGGIWEPTAANFPALKHFFKCNEATNDTVLVDSVGGLRISGTSALFVTNNGDGTLDTSNDVFNVIDSGTVASPAAKNVLLLWGGKPTNAAGATVTFGNITSAGFRSTAQTTTGSRVYADGTGTVSVGTTTNLAGNGSQLQSRALALTWASATGFAPYDFDGTTATARSTTLSSGTSMASLTGITTINQEISINGGAFPGFIQVWHFTTLPGASEIKAAMAWTHYHAFTSPYNKFVYPGFKGLT